MFIVVLGSAAGGGFPQWNCNAPTSRGVREGTLNAKSRTQASIAVSSDGANWLLINASPDFRQQQLSTRQLWPRAGLLRHTPIKAVLLTSAEIDHVAGLLSMRESQSFALWATQRVHDILAENPIFGALNPAYVERRAFHLHLPWEIAGRDEPLGLTIEAFPVPGKVPLFLESRNVGNLAGVAEDTTGLRVSQGATSFFYIPGCAELTPALRAQLRGAQLVFFDGTLWSDDELVRLDISSKTGKRMGHMSIDGEDGTIAAFRDLDVGRKIFIHVNTTNPIFDEESKEHAAMRRAGWEVAEDGMEIQL
ncbi:MAG TPA: pyrroloquinoline quinone biosynthesis protein PqqB [Terriglobia bacterium]|nr:pyrroloquinoline quinone biosynthesis protein PqqB [Terriglobia bacterium]